MSSSAAAPAIRPVVTVILPLGRYTYMDSPDPLHDLDGVRCLSLPDDEQKIIWIDPSVTAEDRPRVYVEALQFLWIRQAQMVPVVC
jgi:hypothetical protein